MRPPFVPDEYHPTSHRGATLWSRRPADLVAQRMEQAVAEVARCLDHRLTRRLHVVAYDSEADCNAALGRPIHPTALLAPVHLPELAVIALHAPHTHPRNRDPARMLRHLCHEVAHVHVAEVTGSRKVLGDDHAGMRVRPWVDEGIAECASAVAAGDPSVIARALERIRVPMDDDAIDAALLDLDHPERATAFAHATVRVWRAAAEHGLPAILRQATHPGSWP